MTSSLLISFTDLLVIFHLLKTSAPISFSFLFIFLSVFCKLQYPCETLLASKFTDFLTSSYIFLLLNHCYSHSWHYQQMWPHKNLAFKPPIPDQHFLSFQLMFFNIFTLATLIPCYLPSLESIIHQYIHLLNKYPTFPPHSPCHIFF